MKTIAVSMNERAVIAKHRELLARQAKAMVAEQAQPSFIVAKRRRPPPR
jgi:hypothetical protein